MLYQLNDHGPIALESVALERIAFSEKRDEFYATEMVEKEPIKGNFTSVAGCTLSGRVLGPTNYHTFQKTIRALYDQRFSRRMSFGSTGVRLRSLPIQRLSISGRKKRVK